MGVPKAVDFWVDAFSYIVVGIAKGLLDSEEIEETDIDYDDPENGEHVVDKAYRLVNQMDGKKVMEWVLKLNNYSDLKDLLNDPNFSTFPMYKPSITLTLMFYPDKLWNAEFKNKEYIEAYHGWQPETLKLAKLGGSNVVFTGQEFGFKAYLPHSWLENLDVEKFRKTLKSVIAHEMTHAYEIYNRYKRNGDPFMGRGTILNAAAKMMKDIKYPQWNSFLHLIYLHLSFEINARITQFYYTLKKEGVKSKEEFMTELKKSGIWKEIKGLETFNAEDFMKSFTQKKLGFEEILTDIGRQAAREKRGMAPIRNVGNTEENMKHLINGWDITLQGLNKEIAGMGLYKNKFMDVVPQKAKENPLVFFKFFEKRFHKSAKSFKRKILRLASLVLDEQNEKSN